MKKSGAKLFSGLLAVCMLLSLFAGAPTGALAAGSNETAILTGIQAKMTLLVTDSWTGTLKKAFEAAAGITAATTELSWYDTSAAVTAGDCAEPWNGTVYSIPAATPLPVVVGDTSEYYDGAGDVIMTAKLTAAGTYEFHVYTAETLSYVMARFTGNVNGTVYLERDIDLNGAEYGWPNTRMVQGQVFDGKGHTVYNLGIAAAQQNSRAGFITTFAGSTLQNVTFNNAYIINDANTINNGKVGTGIIGYAEGANERIANVHAVNSVSVCSEQAGTVLGRMVGSDAVITGCSAENCTVFGQDHVGSLTAALVGLNSQPIAVSNSFTTGCVVISTGSHSGGFISCGSGLNVSECFTDVSVYGMSKTGVFTGGLNGTVNISNCFASGFIEGSTMVGGFIGEQENAGNADVITVTSCYTSALVGLNYSGESMGGFIGDIDSRVEGATFTDCYAAGEVGTVSTAITATASQPDKVGGFVGSIGLAGASFTSCYYDKQLTAMRECGVGGNAAGADISGVTGILTTATEKTGAGLSGLPGTSGFTGFANDTAWVFDSGSANFPQLAVFRDAAAAVWGTEAAKLVRAYSRSSTSGVVLDTWDYQYDMATGTLGSVPLPETTYDTARDITSDFLLTSNASVSRWTRTGVQNGADGSGASSTVNGETRDVLDLKFQNGQYLCDELVPGTEWLRVYTKVDGAVGSRRMRVIPTAAIEAGESAVVSGMDSLYDHRSDVEMYYSTAAYSAVHYTDYPGDPDSDGYCDVDAGAISFAAGDSADGSRLFVYARRITGIDTETGAIDTTDAGGDTLIGWSDSNPLRITSGSGAQAAATYAEEFRGDAQFTNTDARYLVSYLWLLSDGRVIQDAKIIRTVKTPFDVELNVYKNSFSSDNSTLYNGGVYTLVSSPDAAHAYSPAILSPQARGAYDLNANAAISWRLNNSEDTLKSITLTMGVITKENGETVETFATTFVSTNDAPLVDGSTLTMKYVFYRIVYKDGGYYTIPESVSRDYTLRIDDAGVYSIEFAYDSYAASGMTFDDMEFDLRADVVVSSSTPT